MSLWASTLLGVVVGALLTYLIAVRSEAERRGEAARRERREALAELLGCLYSLVGFMREWPEELPPSLLERAHRETVGRSARMRTRDWVITQKRLREVLGDNLYEPVYRFTFIYARLQLLEIDASVRVAVEAAAAYVERLAKHRDPETLELWMTIRMELLRAIANSGDSSAIDAAAPAERLAEATVPTSDMATPGSSEADRQPVS
jgi:hypothetical protein